MPLSGSVGMPCDACPPHSNQATYIIPFMTNRLAMRSLLLTRALTTITQVVASTSVARAPANSYMLFSTILLYPWISSTLIRSRKASAINNVSSAHRKFYIVCVLLTLVTILLLALLHKTIRGNGVLCYGKWSHRLM